VEAFSDSSRLLENSLAHPKFEPKRFSEDEKQRTLSNEERSFEIARTRPAEEEEEEEDLSELEAQRILDWINRENDK